MGRVVQGNEHLGKRFLGHCVTLGEPDPKMSLIFLGPRSAAEVSFLRGFDDVFTIHVCSTVEEAVARAADMAPVVAVVKLGTTAADSGQSCCVSSSLHQLTHFFRRNDVS